MSRVAIRELLGGDTELNAMGVTLERIWPNFALDVSPRDGVPYVILRWGSRPGRFGSQAGGQQSLTVWVYRSRQAGVDYTDILRVTDRITKILLAVEQYEGSDGSVVTTVDFNGESEDLADEGYDALAKNVAFTVVCR